MTLKLYEIAPLWQQIQDALVESGGELTPEVESLLARLEDEGAAKIDAAMCVDRHYKASSEFLAGEISRLQARKAAVDGAQVGLRNYVLPAVIALGGKVKTPRFTVYTTKRRSFAIELAPGHDVWELDARFYRTREPELNKTEIKKAIEAGEAAPEALVIAESESVSLAVR